MGHGDINLDVYSKVWDECYSQVLFLPSKTRFTRANAASKKDRIESAEQKLEVRCLLFSHRLIFYFQLNRNLMALEAKRAAKLEKKLKTLLGGYQARGQALVKALNDVYDQIDQAQLEAKTFDLLRQNELLAVPKRLEVIQENFLIRITLPLSSSSPSQMMLLDRMNVNVNFNDVIKNYTKNVLIFSNMNK